MKTEREIAKIKAVEGYILRLLGGTSDFIKLFKLLYFAQQRCLVELGRPLVEDTFRAVRRGPVPSFTYKAYQEALAQHFTSPDINVFVDGLKIYKDKEGIGRVDLQQEPDIAWISGIERKIIDEVVAQMSTVSSDRLSQLSHEDEAWQAARKRADRDPEKNIISQIDIAKAGGADREMVSYIREKQIIKQGFAR